MVNLKNKFAYEENITVMVASYDINNKLLDCQFKPVKVEYGENGKTQKIETEVVDVPENTHKAKAFCWSATTLIP